MICKEIKKMKERKNMTRVTVDDLFPVLQIESHCRFIIYFVKRAYEQESFLILGRAQPQVTMILPCSVEILKCH